MKKKRVKTGGGIAFDLHLVRFADFGVLLIIKLKLQL